MKKLIIILTIFILSFTAVGADQGELKILKNSEVKVKLTETGTGSEAGDTPAVKQSEVEIEIVEQVGIDKPSSSTQGTSSPDTTPPIIISELAPANPDKNLVIYFILLMTIVIGIMLMATLIPGPKAKQDTK